MSTTIAAPAIARTVAMPRSPMQLAVRRFLHRPVAVAGLAVIVLFVSVAVFAPLIAPYDPVATSWSAIRKAPSLAHWMGTDENGRDVLSRVVFGARASLLAGAMLIGIVESITATFYGPSWAPAVAFGFLLLTLAVRPAGILGR